MNFSRLLLTFGLIASAFVLVGCSSPAQTNAMVPTSMGPVTNHVESITLNVTGGSETTATSPSQIANENFAAALGQSILQSGLFAKVSSTGLPAVYHLEVMIVRLQQPLFGFSMTVTIETSWNLTRLSDHAVIWQKSITTSHTAKTGESFAAVTRLRLATEGAARDNIQDAITHLGLLPLN